jgi:hypothetical protein
MSDEHALSLQQFAIDWLRDSSWHYRQLARRLRGIAAGCRLPKPQRELLNLAARYERRADHFDARRELQ